MNYCCSNTLTYAGFYYFFKWVVLVWYGLEVAILGDDFEDDRLLIDSWEISYKYCLLLLCIMNKKVNNYE